MICYRFSRWDNMDYGWSGGMVIQLASIRLSICAAFAIAMLAGHNLAPISCIENPIEPDIAILMFLSIVFLW